MSSKEIYSNEQDELDEQEIMEELRDLIIS